MAETGRPTIWTTELEERILAHIETGHSEKASAGACGVALSTYTDHKRESAGFSERVHVARSKGIIRLGNEALGATKNAAVKVRLHRLQNLDECWREVKRIEHSGTVTLADLARAAEETAEGDGA